MLSVLIIDTKVFDHYSKYDYFFGHFETNDDVAVCVWNKQSIEDDVSSMLPQLMDTVRNVPEWNAYIICEPHDPMAYLEGDFANKTQYSVNPYERANRPDYDPQADRLLKLVYYLGGRGDDRVDYIQQYQFRAARPSNIYLITPRLMKNIEQQKLFLLSALQQGHQDVMDDPARILAGETDITRNYAEFWERYEYPASCRFLVYDFPEEKHQTYQDSWFPFWTAVISMTQNRFTNAVLAPYKLHLLDVAINDDKFAEYINQFYTMLLENKDINQRAIELEEHLEKEEAASTDITVGDSMTPVYVNFPHFSEGDLFADDENIGIFKDRPVLDEEDWSEQMTRTHEAIGKFFKAIGRGKGEAVDFVHDSYAEELPDLQGKRITKYDAEELTEALNQDELRMVDLDLGYTASRAKFEKAQHKAEKIVETYMRRRLRMKIAIGLLAACMGIYFIGFIPYLINSLAHSGFSFLIALLISAVAMVVPAACGLAMLFVLKRNMKKLIGLYNDTVAACFVEAQKGSELQAEYLTLLFDYMKKYQLLSTAKDNNTHSLRIQQLLISNAVFDDAIAACTALAALRNVPLRRITDRYVENTIDTTPEAQIYLYEENVDGKMALNSTPDVLEAPFPFTESFALVPEELYECAGYTQGKEATA
ncbi:MAG: hypothetical protein IJ518_00465 [Clostridia bacterium]|nr:hypothetical protein [Clostridia bacterium]